MAVRAFNKQLIDQFIDKHDPNLKARLNSAVNAFQDQYFRGSFKLVSDQIIASHHDGFLADQRFQAWFKDQRTRQGIIEYYLLDGPQSGFLLANAAGECKVLLVHTRDALREHRQHIAALEAPAELLAGLDKASLVPAFDTTKPLAPGSDPLMHWQQHYHAASPLDKDSGFITAMLAPSATSLGDLGQILSFNDFLRGIVPAHATLH